MKNNKGFAITTILFGSSIIFALLLVSLLSILSRYRNNLLLLVDNNNGTRDIITIKETKKNNGARFDNENEIIQYIMETDNGGLFCLKSGVCKYYSSNAQ